MDTYVKIDRVSGSVLSRESKDNPVRAFHKPVVSLKQVTAKRPVFDPERQRLAQKEAPSEDVSDLSRPVSETAVWNVTWEVVDLTPTELVTKRNVKIAATDSGIIRGVEDLLVALIEKALISKTDVSAVLVDKINARRALRGETLL